MDKLQLQKKPTLPDFQEYLKEMVEVRGFSGTPVPMLFMLLLEECGELAKAARKATKMKVDANSEVLQVEDEVADVFIYLLRICNEFNIDLEQAFRQKEEKNKQREWK